MCDKSLFSNKFCLNVMEYIYCQFKLTNPLFFFIYIIYRVSIFFIHSFKNSIIFRHVNFRVTVGPTLSWVRLHHLWENIFYLLPLRDFFSKFAALRTAPALFHLRRKWLGRSFVDFSWMALKNMFLTKFGNRTLILCT